MFREEKFLRRHEGNPVIKPSMLAGAEAMMNGCPFLFNGKIMILQPVIFTGREFPQMHLCESDDGISFRINPEPFIKFTDDQASPLFHVDRWLIDPRVTQIGDTYYIMRPGDSYLGTVAILGRTKDWKTYEHMEIVSLPMNRVPCLFPEKIGGEYVRIDRPSGRNEGNLWISRSPDLIYWGKHRHLQNPWAHWNRKKIGPCVPIRTDIGWLVLTHGVNDSCAGSRYSLTAIMLDLENPEIVIGKMNSWILTPETDYEFNGNVPNVVFACAAIPDFAKDELKVYYGATDTYMCLATGSISEIMKACMNGD